ncbi:helix-turn-helix domain-containing protein [Olavius algarvensis spirochete endosymbiont]|uniref:helix-turn-helix domain-containing protein n=1 Tax=Olavius algarvensis spirochete endosymbiont TaxID=260710 RepID=UPI0018A86148|nr:helix-turn-helix transcriptional regulator [Olavius algarvensis spirochete endosymbiont]
MRNLSAEEKNTIALGKRLAELRKKRGHTQIELAQKMNLIQSVISAYERGRIRMTSEVLIQFCSALNVTPSVLLGIESENESELSLKIVKRMLKIQQLPLSKQKRLFATIDDTLKANDLLP